MGCSVSHYHSVPRGEPPPPAPGACFGRVELIEEVVELAEIFEPVALIGPGGIGKTSIALEVLHHYLIEDRFGDNRRFIRCDQFPPTRAHFLAKLSKVIGAGVENPEDLTTLRPFLSSKEMFIILDNAESILDPQGPNIMEIYSVVEELCQIKTISLLITSRIATVPRNCKRLQIPTLSMKAALDAYYHIYSGSEQSEISSDDEQSELGSGDEQSELGSDDEQSELGSDDEQSELDGDDEQSELDGDNELPRIIRDHLRRVDFIPLSITLLATAASRNVWDRDQLAKEWKTQRARVLQTDYNASLVTAIELLLTSPTFHKLGRDLLEFVAFFPQGVDESNLDWLFPTIPDRKNIFNEFCALFLTYRSNGFVMMLAPIRDYLSPRDPRSSPLLCTTRDRYFCRLSVDVNPCKPGFEEARWIVSEDVNVEHLLDVFISFDQNAPDAWDAGYYFMRHLYWHKPRQTILRSRIEALPDDYYPKQKFSSELSRLFGRVGNCTEQKRLLTHILELERRSGNIPQVAQTLQYLSDANRLLGLHEEGIKQATEALEIYERRGGAEGQAQCLNQLAWLFFDAQQSDAAENAASRAMDLATEEDQEYLLCQLHRVLGKIYHRKGEKTLAAHYFETALGIASPPNWNEELFWTHHSLAELFGSEEEFDDANAHIEKARTHAAGDAYRLGRAMEMQANVWCLQRRVEDAKSEAMRALKIFEACGATCDAGASRNFIRMVEQAIEF